MSIDKDSMPESLRTRSSIDIGEALWAATQMIIKKIEETKSNSAAQAQHSHFWRTVERDGKWLTECETCGAPHVETVGAELKKFWPNCEHPDKVVEFAAHVTDSLRAEIKKLKEKYER